MTWINDHWSEIFTLARSHVWLAGVPLILGLLIALPLGWAARRWSRLYPVLISTSGLLYTIPSLALFVLMPLILGTQVLNPINVVVAMTVYTVALLVRTVADGLGSVPDHVLQAARAMGYRGFRRFFGIELPLAIPVIAAGLRVAAVSNVSIVSVASLIGVSQLGNLLTDGYDRFITPEIVIGIVSCVVLALLFDGLILLGQRLLTPWVRAQGGRS
ncbi:ABC-type glycine betaine transport, permease protein [Janibacter sp. HTCC2649]|uniref:ABC transporter permease n=1 Tax=Janibacter sp. HTCC2649 TaxID=313589 RepID=UPI0000670A05|nr:ABC transporter permease [Janibacter sp. HTCC2649]EAQ00764.1 ABC-type glycine betaine transport, permease protein [Janibacter sp. HTCC2649]